MGELEKRGSFYKDMETGEIIPAKVIDGPKIEAFVNQGNPYYDRTAVPRSKSRQRSKKKKGILTGRGKIVGTTIALATVSLVVCSGISKLLKSNNENTKISTSIEMEMDDQYAIDELSSMINAQSFNEKTQERIEVIEKLSEMESRFNKYVEEGDFKTANSVYVSMIDLEYTKVEKTAVNLIKSRMNEALGTPDVDVYDTSIDGNYHFKTADGQQIELTEDFKIAAEALYSLQSLKYYGNPKKEDINEQSQQMATVAEAARVIADFGQYKYEYSEADQTMIKGEKTVESSSYKNQTETKGKGNGM